MQAQCSRRTQIKTRFGKQRLFPVLLLVTLITSFTIPLTVHSSTPYTKIEHSIQITEAGLLLVTDIITLQNNGPESITHFPIGFPISFTNNLDNVLAQTVSGEPLSIEENRIEDDTGIYWMDIQFPKEIGVNESYNFSVAFAFSRLISSNISESENTAVFPEYPAVSQEAATCRATIHLVSGKLVNSSWGNSTTHIVRPLKANSNQTGWVTYLGYQHVIECTNVQRDIVLDSWGNIQSYATYKIRNLGRTNIPTFSFPLPNDAENVVAYDDFGSLTATLTDLSGQQGVSITFRYPLRGESDTSQNHDSYRFTIAYTQKTQDHQSPLTPFTLNLEIFPSPDFTLKNVKTRVTFPEGAAFLEASPSPSTTSENLLTQSITYNNKNVAPFTQSQLSITYDFNIFWAAFRPTLWLSAILFVIAGIIVINRRKKPKPPPVPDKNLSMVRTLIEACGERIGLWNELETLEIDFDNRRIRRKDFNRRRRIFTQRLSSVNREITNLSKSLQRQGAPYTGLIATLNSAEAEIRSSRTEINRLRNQRQRGQLSNNTYRQRRKEYDTQLQKAKGLIDEVITELKNIIR